MCVLSSTDLFVLFGKFATQDATWSSTSTMLVAPQRPFPATNPQIHRNLQTDSCVLIRSALSGFDYNLTICIIYIIHFIFFFHSYLLVSCTSFSVEALRGVQLGGLSRHKRVNKSSRKSYILSFLGWCWCSYIFARFVIFVKANRVSRHASKVVHANKM